MIDQGLRDGLVGLTAIVLIGLLTLPALRHAFVQMRTTVTGRYQPIGGDADVLDQYEDEDGVATEESIKTYSRADIRPRIAAGLAVTVGLGSSIATRVLTWTSDYSFDDPEAPMPVVVFSRLSQWSDPVCWTLICVQLACLPSIKAHCLPQSRFRMTLMSLLSTLLLATSIATREGLEGLAAISNPNRNTAIIGILILTQFAASLSAAASFASFRRRPDVYDPRNRHLVDQQHSQSVLGALSFSWNHAIFTAANTRVADKPTDGGKAKPKFGIEDLPTPDAATRSRTLLQRFLAETESAAQPAAEGSKKDRLWWQLIRVFWRELATQWTLTLGVAVVALAPQVMLYRFLDRLESPAKIKLVDSKTGAADPALFVWVLGLLLSQLLQVVMGNWLRWITFSKLSIPVTAALQALVFSKALKQYESAAPAEKDEEGKKTRNTKKKANDDGADDNNKKQTKPGSKGKGKIVNHMRLDSSRVANFCQCNINFPMALFKLVLAGSFLVRLMGWRPVVAGLACGALLAPVSAVLSNRYGRVVFGLMRYRDAKAHLLTEALEGMRQIRFSALENHWEEKILKSREEELGQYWRLMLSRCMVILMGDLGPLLLASVAFAVYVWEAQSRGGVRASVIFTALGLFNQLDEAISLLPLLQMYLVEAFVSADRLEKYFRAAEKESVVVSRPEARSIVLENVTVAWPGVEEKERSLDNTAPPTPKGSRSMLRDITIEFPAEKLSVITGTTGAGKSLLLAAILGEVKLISGTIRSPFASSESENDKDLVEPAYIPESEWILPSATSYVSQNPWIESGTVKENIIFGLPFHPQRYRETIRACALETDIELLVDGDETEVGPKGVTLSGGQKWRVALARALYSRAGTIVLDDVLSAVDAHVGRRIVEGALGGELARGRTRILATHHAELVVPRASLLVKLGDDGRLVSAEEMRPIEDEGSSPSVGEDGVEGFGDDSTTQVSDSPAEDSQRKNDKRVTAQKEEEREQGHVKMKVYRAYFKASGGILWWTFVVIILIGSNLMIVARTWSLKELAQQATKAAGASVAPLPIAMTVNDDEQIFTPSSPQALMAPRNGAHDTGHGIWFWLAVYVVLGFGRTLASMVGLATYFHMGLKASRSLFKRMTHAVLRAPLRWFDTVPSGRILNRFQSDTFTVDNRLAMQCFALLRSLMTMVVIVGTSISVSIYVIIFGLFLLVLYARIAIAYISVAREVKRINSTAHSPLFDQLGSVLPGLATVRAFGRTRAYMDRMHGLIDRSSQASWALQLSSRWMAFRMGMIGAVFVAAVASAVAFAAVSGSGNGIDAALAGFGLTFALRYTAALTNVLQNVTSVELGFSACERVLEFAEMPTEAEDDENANYSDEEPWPSRGEVEVSNLTVSYAPELPPVLHNLDFTVKAGERVGVVGRTGAGKSTLAAVLFRLIEPGKGAVCIDGVDITTVGLARLRGGAGQGRKGRMAIIPQEPFLFSGTLRSNLDMEGVRDDEELREVLRRVCLARPREENGDGDGNAAQNPGPETETGAQISNTNIFNDLSTPISAGGANLSQGQRQLVCLARALLARPRLLVLDEATSAVDKDTDAAIQVTLRGELTSGSEGCTVLVIAHRLSTVADFDRILVLDRGRLAEMGSPKELVEEGMRKEAEEEKIKMETETGVAAQITGESEAGGTSSGDDGTQVGDEEQEQAAIGAGAFWELVKRSGERETLLQMIFGQDSKSSGEASEEI